MEFFPSSSPETHEEFALKAQEPVEIDTGFDFGDDFNQGEPEPIPEIRVTPAAAEAPVRVWQPDSFALHLESGPVAPFVPPPLPEAEPEAVVAAVPVAVQAAAPAPIAIAPPAAVFASEPVAAPVPVPTPAPRPVLVAEPTPIAAPAPIPIAAPSSAAGKSADDFSSLEQRVLQAVELVRRERLARIAAEEKLAAYEADVLEQLPLVDRLQQEVDLLRQEREQIKQRVDRLLTQLDSLEL